MKALLFSLIMITIVEAHAIDKVRNGGAAIQCSYNSYQMYDLYEGQTLYGIPMDIPEGKDEIEIAHKVIDRLQAIEPKRAERYTEFLYTFFTDTQFVFNGLTPIDDIGEGMANPPKGCALVQAASQTRIDTPLSARYALDLSVWRHLDKENRAVLILHEIIYRDAYSQNKTMKNSAGVRYFNALLFSELLPKKLIAPRAYIDAARTAGFQTVEYDGYSLLLHSNGLFSDRIIPHEVVFYPNGDVREAYFHEVASRAPDQPSIQCEDMGEIHIYFNKNKSSGATLKSTCTMSIKKEAGPHRYSVSANWAQFSLDRELLSVSFKPSLGQTAPQLKFRSSQWFIFGKFKDGTVLFWNNGQMRRFDISLKSKMALTAFFLGKRIVTESPTMTARFLEDGSTTPQ